MRQQLGLSAGVVAGGLIAGAIVRREHAGRRSAERFTAAALETLLNAIDAHDHETGAHVRRVACYALSLAEVAELDERSRLTVEQVALFHDIGKIHEALFDIIHDRSTLSPAEWNAIATHPARGARVLEPLSAFYPDLAEGVLSHHERWDGSGYPRGLQGTEIPLAARIVAIADSFDAITHRRRYRDGRPGDEAAAMIAAGRGTQFDPELTDLFLFPPVFERIRADMRKSNKPRTRRGERRVGKGLEAPDITFRWRSGARARHGADAPRSRSDSRRRDR
jgi:HD-GYP domain-containing protein (c-di-GMP phosphodiesterase class II)